MQYDIVIIGGGLVGTGLVVALQGTGLRIALIDARLPSNNDHRLFALNASSCQFLQNLNVWDTIQKHAAPIHQVHVSRQGRFGSVRLKREEVHAASLGHVIPAKEVEGALNALVESLPKDVCHIYRPAKLHSLIQCDTAVELTVSSRELLSIEGARELRIARSGSPGMYVPEIDSSSLDETVSTLKASLVIGADGADSTVRRELKIVVDEVDYEQTAIVFKTTLHRSHENIAYERFTNHGAIAMLPLPENQCASIWSAKNNKAKELLALNDDEFLQTLQQEFGYRLGRLQAVGQRYSYPLRMRQAKQAVAGRVMLIGNAAHSLHPIAAQGFNIAVHEVAALVDALKNGATPANLDRAHQQSKKQLTMSMGVSSKLPNVFDESNWMSTVAQVGMVGLDVLSPLKQYFIKGMMGKRGTVPSLLLNTKEL